jgi:hypothetical protein
MDGGDCTLSGGGGRNISVEGLRADSELLRAYCTIIIFGGDKSGEEYDATQFEEG